MGIFFERESEISIFVGGENEIVFHEKDQYDQEQTVVLSLRQLKELLAVGGSLVEEAENYEEKTSITVERN